jgi:hypothetical protein
LAWGVHDADNTKDIKNDLNYTEWAPFLEITNLDQDNEKKIISLDYHVCTDQDYSEFYTPRIEDKDSVSAYKESKTLYCLNKKDKFGNQVDIELASSSGI